MYIGALDGDQFGHSGVAQCGSSSYPHDTRFNQEDGDIAVETSCNVNTTEAGTFICNYTATDSQGLSDNATRVVIVEENVIEPVCTEYTDSNSSHKTAGRAYSESNFYWWSTTTSYYATGSRDSISGSSTSTSTLHTKDGVAYSEGSCSK